MDSDAKRSQLCSGEGLDRCSSSTIKNVSGRASARSVDFVSRLLQDVSATPADNDHGPFLCQTEARRFSNTSAVTGDGGDFPPLAKVHKLLVVTILECVQ